jgi:N-acetylmuramoyl-L-alanine amidase
LRICLDPGHGGEDPGAVGLEPFELHEKDFNLCLAQRLEVEIENHGWEVIATRRQDRTLALEARAAFANRYEADLFVSLHANAAATAEAEGMEVFHFPGSGHGRSLALHVLDRLLHHFPDHRNRGVKTANFTVLRRTAMPAILVEHEFLTHPRQLEFLADPCRQDRLAQAVFEGIVAAVEGPYQTTVPKLQLGIW